MHDVDVIVIGSGAGGMAAALALAKAGKSVRVFEQHYLPGGWCHSFSLGGHQFSPGVHYIGGLGTGGLLARAFRSLGVANDLCFHELNPDGYDRIRIGEERFDIPAGLERYRARLKDRFPRESRGIDGYLDGCRRMANQLIEVLPAESAREWATLPWRLRDVIRDGLQPLDRYLDRFTQDPLLRGILSMQSGDHGLGPERVPTIQHAAVVNHYFEGGWYPRGGAKAIPKAFIKALRRHGGAIQVRAPVARILTERGRAIGVRLADGTEVRAAAVVSNADPHMTFARLLPPELVGWRIRRRLARTRWSVSALSLFFAVDMDLRAAGLDSGNTWYSVSPDINGAYRVARDADPSAIEAMPCIFLTATTLKDPSKLKKGIHTCESFVFLDYDAFVRWHDTHFEGRPDDYAAHKAHLMDLMFQRLDDLVEGIRDHVVFAELGTPLSNRHFVASHRGNLYGTEKVLSQIGPFGFPVQTPIPGLYLCGSSTVGHGVAACTMSGLAVAKRILGCRRDALLQPEPGQSMTLLPADPPSGWAESEARTGAAVPSR